MEEQILQFSFLSLKIMDLLYVVNLQFVWRGPISEVETDFLTDCF